jgi:hypothetical protein
MFMGIANDYETLAKRAEERRGKTPTRLGTPSKGDKMARHSIHPVMAGRRSGSNAMVVMGFTSPS